jgi:heme-binding uptake protein ChaN (Tiki superfamily)
MRRFLCAALLLSVPPLAAGEVPAPAVPAPDFLARASAPIDYVLSTLQTHRIVLLGEAHWLGHDANLVSQLVPRLPAAGATALGIEMFRASDQPRIDALVSAPEWDPRKAMAIMRAAKWPYQEYLDIIHAAWKANQGGQRLRLLALGPDDDWREILLPKGGTYETFMAEVVTVFLVEPRSRILTYSGLNHAFTRYHQPEMPRAVRVEGYFDRMGNILWRRFGEGVFVIVLHHPWRCYASGQLSRCLPAGGSIECAALDRDQAVGFDLRSSPFASARLEGFEYALGYPDLRRMDIADGYLWQKPLRQYQSVALIPLSQFAPDAASLTEVSRHSPFVDTRDSTPEELEKQWREQAEWLRDPLKATSWEVAVPRCGP